MNNTELTARLEEEYSRGYRNGYAMGRSTRGLELVPDDAPDRIRAIDQLQREVCGPFRPRRALGVGRRK